MKEYGGCLYFEPLLEEKKREQYYSKYEKNKIDVDSGRSAIQYILEIGRYNRIWLPVYNCPLVAQRIIKISNIKICWYNLNENFVPDINQDKLKKGDVLLWVNYCGVMFERIIDEVVGIKEKTGVEIIVDNIPAYFSSPKMDVINIYSCRKFLGVPDGGHIIGKSIVPTALPAYLNADHYLYLLRAIETGSNLAYADYQENENRFSESATACGMPILTSKVLEMLDYTEIKSKRRTNFEILHDQLGGRNRLNFNTKTVTPSVYPYLTSDRQLRQKLLTRRVYISQFWKHVLASDKANSFEKDLAEYLIPLPIDQRYTKEDMKNLIDIVKELES